jgi:hypothetical protein
MTDGSGTGAGGAVAGAIAGAAEGGQAGAEGGAGAGTGAEAGAGAGADGQAAGADAADRWQDKWLPEDLRADETLAVYKSPEDAFKALVETKKWARGRIAVPGAEDAEGFAEFVGKVRPAKAEDYAILDADGKPSEIGEAFRGKFHELGLHPLQAKGIVGAWNQYQRDIVSQAEQVGKDELMAVELEHGPAGYNQRLSAVENMFRSLDLDIPDVANAMQQMSGAGATMRALFKLAEATGELTKVDSTATAIRMGSMTPDAAQAEINRQNATADPEERKALADPKSPLAQRRKELFRIIAKARDGGGNQRA